MRFRRSLIAIGLILIFGISPSSAAETLVINSNNGSSPLCGGYIPFANSYSMKFQAGSSSAVTKLVVLASDASSAIYAEIRQTDQTGTLGTLVGTFTYSSKAASGSFYLVTFTGNVNVVSGTQYWLVIRQSSSTSYTACYDTVAPTYSGGFSFIQNNGNFDWATVGNYFAMAQHYNLYMYINGVSDTTPPVITSGQPYSVAENSTSVGTIRTNESSTISIFGGQDQNKFQIAQSDSTTAALSFIAAPNFEVPTDVGADNNYQVVLKAQDTAGNVAYETVTATVTDVDENARVTSYTIASAPVKGTPVNIVATVNFPGKVTFLANKKRIPGCISIPTSGSGPITAACGWKPAARGSIGLTFLVVPTAANNFATTSAPAFVSVGSRSNIR
jgi:hypothetical protein